MQKKQREEKKKQNQRNQQDHEVQTTTKTNSSTSVRGGDIRDRGQVHPAAAIPRVLYSLSLSVRSVPLVRNRQQQQGRKISVHLSLLYLTFNTLYYRHTSRSSSLTTQPAYSGARSWISINLE